MDFFDFLTLIGGLAFFLYGMNVLSEGLERLAGGKLESILRSMTSNTFKAMLLGTAVTALIQSSSAVTVMLVGLVNSGIMSVSQTVGVIMGSNIGTTVTAWLLSMVGIESDNIFVQLLKPENFCLAFAFIGIMMIMLSKSQKKHDIGKILIGFAVLMYGMEFMSAAVEELKGSEGFVSLLTTFENPILGILVGTVFTMIIQSSSASVGILQAIAMTGSVTFGAAIPIVMGMNIGTCVTALISSIGVSKNARKVPVIHFTVKVIGTIVWCVIFYGVNAFMNWDFVGEAISPVMVAIVHTVFNIATTAMLLPFSKQLVKFANMLVKERAVEKVDTIPFIDERLMRTPAVAVSECNNISKMMAKISIETVDYAIENLYTYSQPIWDMVKKGEDDVDIYEDRLGTYLVQLSAQALSDKDSQVVSKMLHAIGDFERISDHAVNILKVSKEMHDKGLKFSVHAQNEVKVLSAAIREIIKLTDEAYEENDLSKAALVEPLEQVIDKLTAKIRNNHIERLRKGECTVELGFVLSDFLNNCSRVSDHCSNIAVAIIEVEHNSMDTHQYLSNIKYGGSKEFTEVFEEYASKYVLGE